MCASLFSRAAYLTVFIACLILLPTQLWATGTERTIYVFQGGKDGVWPSGGLISDASGNLYGTTRFGGGSSRCGSFQNQVLGCGTVFKMSQSNGKWTETPIYTFQGQPDGAVPESSLVIDSLGNLYGTTYAGGVAGQGAVFELSPPQQQGGAWTESILYNLSSTNNDGLFAVSLAIDQKGNLYGTNPGFPDSHGSIFELSPPSQQGGQWTYNLLYTFQGGAKGDGSTPVGALVLGKSGNLYGTTWLGGTGAGCNADGCGTVFQLMPPGGKRKAWAERVLYKFSGGSDGGEPYSGVTLDRFGNLYGTTGYGGNMYDDGTVFELSPAGGGKWAETVLHTFDHLSEGAHPTDRVIFDKLGNLYSTTNFSDVFELSPPSQHGGQWTETIGYNFSDNNPSNLLLNKWGTALYGTFQGSVYGGGPHGEIFTVIMH